MNVTIINFPKHPFCIKGKEKFSKVLTNYIQLHAAAFQIKYSLHAD